MILRPALPTDHLNIFSLLDAAFAPSRYESALVRLVMARPEAASPHHAWVAELDGKVAGYVLYTPAMREAAPIGYHLAPVAVHPGLQRRGIGSALLRHTLQQPSLANQAVFVLGDPAYYERFGFTRVLDALCPYDEDNAHFRALRWQDNPGEAFTIGYIDAFREAETLRPS